MLRVDLKHVVCAAWLGLAPTFPACQRGGPETDLSKGERSAGAERSERPADDPQKARREVEEAQSHGAWTFDQRFRRSQEQHQQPHHERQAGNADGPASERTDSPRFQEMKERLGRAYEQVKSAVQPAAEYIGHQTYKALERGKRAWHNAWQSLDDEQDGEAGPAQASEPDSDP